MLRLHIHVCPTGWIHSHFIGQELIVLALDSDFLASARYIVHSGVRGTIKGAFLDTLIGREDFGLHLLLVGRIRVAYVSTDTNRLLSWLSAVTTSACSHSHRGVSS
jgi:hypothetical protein